VEENQIEVEWLILADAAQVVGNKLYLLGGGWDVLTVNSGFPVQHPFAVAVSFRVPWSETNRPFGVEVEIQDADGNVLVTVAGKAEVGRPPGIPVGHPQRTQIAANVALPLPKAGTYVIVARIEGTEKERVPFNVVPGPMLLMQQQKEPGAA
jgi:hypothetical protein